MTDKKIIVKKHLKHKVNKNLFHYIPEKVFWEMFMKSSAYDYFETVVLCIPASWSVTKKQLKRKNLQNKFMDSYYKEIITKSDIRHNLINAQIDRYFKLGRFKGRYHCCRGIYRFTGFGKKYYRKYKQEPYIIIEESEKEKLPKMKIKF